MLFRWSELIILAQQEAAKAPAEPATAPPALLQFLPVILFAMILYQVLVLFPEQRREKKKRELLGSLKKNDRVVTSGGIRGIVAAVRPNDNEVVLKVDEDKDVKLTFSLSSIVEVAGPKDKEAPAS